MIRLAVFDMDGLIFDTERLFMDELAEVMRSEGYELTLESYLEILGLNNEAVKRKMLAFYGEDYPFEEMNEKVRAALDKLARSEGLPVKPGIRELLEFLNKNGVSCAVASSTQSAFVRDYIKQSSLDEFFDVIIGGDMVERSKPEPDIFLEAARRIGVSPNDAVVLEDSENGIRAGAAAGMKVICIPDMKQPAPELARCLFALCADGFEAAKVIGGEILPV
ncbi:MAG: HAD family phosphatase [Clostridiales bacterium]|nr:HAD family phosphatase [Clostridiales bacterium]